MRDRIESLKKFMSRRGLDAFLVTDRFNVSYLSGICGTDASIIVTPGRDYFITDSRYIEDARQRAKRFKVLLVAGSTYDMVASVARLAGIRKLGFESMNLPYGVVKRLSEAVSAAKLVPTRLVVEGLRAVKDAREIEAIKKSVRLTKKVMSDIAGCISPGMAESDVARKAEISFIRGGARPSFDPIVACGANSSKPHARPGRGLIRRSAPVMIDIGCNLDGYCSDITRTIFIGRIDARFKKIYGVVSDAQKLAIGLVKAGVKISAVDRAARGHIAKKGFGKYFGHSLGHGVGMEVHEEPAISPGSEGTLKAGMVFTIEPAVYIPGFGGVRIEDMVLATEGGCEIMTK